MFARWQNPDLNQIKINDPLWGRYINLVADVIVPYQWDILNDRIKDAPPSHCLANFKIAAGELAGEHRGVVFIDSDVYKWLESVAYCIHNGTGKHFESIADDVIALISRAQQKDGYLNTYYTLVEPDQRWTNLVEGHELYCAGHLTEAAVAYYEATGKDELLNISCRFADLICQVFGPEQDQIKGYPGHQEIELALVKLFYCTGVKRYLSCAKFFIDERGKTPNYFEAEIKKREGKVIFPEFRDYELIYAQAHTPVSEQHTAEGHAVRTAYMFSAVADIASEYGDNKMMQICRDVWQSITLKRMYITGGIGSSGIFERFTTDYHLPNDGAYSETCASIGLSLFARRMASIEKDAKYYNIVEKVLYNTVLSGISFDGNRYFYVNPLEVVPEACISATSLQHVKPERQPWFGVACCPTNIARTLASLGRYIYAYDSQTVYVNLFISSSIKIPMMDKIVELDTNSSLLQDGNIDISVKASSVSNFCIAIRIPDYDKSPAFYLNGRQIQPDINNGYAIIESNGLEKFTLSVKIDVSPKWMSADPLVWDDSGKVALMKGPMVYCLEEKDNGDNLSSIYADTENTVSESHEGQFPGNLPALVYKGSRLSRKGWDGNVLYDNARFQTVPVTLKAVPYAFWGNRDPGEMRIWQKAIIK